jgi:predicted MFS family arabinose efflux permease
VSVTVTPRHLERAKVAVAVTFATNGVGFAGWFARTPAVRDELSLTPAALGLLLLCMSGAAVAGVPLAGPVVQRLGPARAVLVAGLSVSAGLAVLATGTGLGVAGIAAVGLALLGLANSLEDVAMNVEAAAVERRLARTLMPRFHAAFSLGTVAGAGLSTATAALGIPVTTQLYATAAVTAAVMLVTVRGYLPAPARDSEQHPRGRVRDAWREPRTILLGVILLGFGFTEGVANDWLAIALVDGYRTTETMGAIGMGFFVVAMTISRLFGGFAVERWGRVAALRTTGVTAFAGLALVVFGTHLPLVLIGAFLWGIGASLGFPLAMSAAADDPRHAAIRVSVAGSVGYGAFIAGPPLIGFLAQHFGILKALLAVIAAVTLGLLASGSAKGTGEAAQPDATS